MTAMDFSLYNNFMTAVLILDNSNRVAFKNVQFVKNFGNIKNLEKFSNYFSFDICVLDSETLFNSSPINFAIDSNESFTATAAYQKTKDQFFYYQITSFYIDDFKLLAFKNITMEMLYEETEKKYSFIRQQYLTVIEENKKASVLQQKAQTQTVKLALMHRISNVIRESMDIHKIIDSAMKELSNLFGAAKVYYAGAKDNGFFIEHVYPQEFKNIINQKVELFEEAKKAIRQKEIAVSSCIKDYANSEISYPSPMNRIIVPVYRLHEILGILMIYTNQRNFEESQNDVLQSIATQLASAIVQASLFSQVKQKNEELEATLEELKETQLQLINSEKMASLGQLVAGVAHEINTPLASINANNDILTKLIKTLPDDAKNLNLFQDINKIDKEAIKRINQIVKSLKKFVRLDESDLQSADINNELDLTVELIKHETKNKIEVVKNYGKIPQIKCYPNMLNQVFMNVLINACQSIEDKGEIVISTDCKDNALIVKIKDNGSGIEESIKERLFVAGTTTKEIGIGTGLGLAISHKIVKKHNGKISFVSEKGKGTEFRIEIPII